MHPDLQRALQGNVIDVNTDEVLRELGHDDADIARLRAEGIVG